ncbi:DUF2196 domain-containing protein [Haloplanus rubicundus]|uniref:DUF2196 domain-containing protein n=1 Tax=Haloplanus rubicundus TaxID=1547898 RepID=A0A345EC68_9EURY|nr:DUF2196 domain-containing protein [Haloplanus rubicundus]AXG09790.1 DUF2196 domain-containing protein [Haloplanus rubicundus]
MSADLPTRDELRQGMTVEIEQVNGDRIVGEVGVVLTDERTHPEGILVKLKSGAEGRVKQIGPEI